MKASQIPEQFLRALSRQHVLMVDLMDQFLDMAFCVKALDGSYVAVNESLVQRAGLSSSEEMIGKTAGDLFPAEMARRYREQDERVFSSGLPVINNLDAIVYPDGSHGWALTSKVPLSDEEGTLIGLAALSKDINSPLRHGYVNARFASTVDYILANFEESLKVPDLAEMAALTTAQLERRFKKVFGVTVGEFINKTRVRAAIVMLETTDTTLSNIAYSCGFCDQSALTRKVKAATGMTPAQYRQMFSGAKRPDGGG
jgi:PAS domain S-box-containing protein